MKIIKQYMSMLLIFFVMVTSCFFYQTVSVKASTIDGVIIGSSTVKVRDRASTKGTIIKTLRKGQNVTIISKTNDWYKIDLGSKYGYIPVLNVDISDGNGDNKDNDNNWDGKKGNVRNRNGVQLRSRPSSNSSPLKKIAYNKTVNIVSQDGKWYKIDDGARYGYVLMSDIEIVSNSSNDDDKNDERLYSKRATPYGSTSVKVRERANESAKIIDTLAKGKYMEVVAESGNWYRVDTGTKFGYVLKSDVTVSKEYKDSVKGIVNRRGGTTVLNKPDGKRKVGTLSYKEQVTVYSKNDDWYKVKVNGQYGYVPMNDIDLD